MSRGVERVILLLAVALFAALWIGKVARYDDLAAYCLEHGTIP